MESQWIGALGFATQWRGVPYVKQHGRGNYECLLCQTGCIKKRNVKSHFRGAHHFKAYNKVKAMGEGTSHNKVNEMKCRPFSVYAKSNQKRIERLSCRKWRDDIKSFVYDISCWSKNHSFDNACSSDVISKLISRYERMEVISLLELAIWTADIFKGLRFQSIHEMKEYIVLDEDLDPSDYSNQMRIRKSVCHVIIPRVIEFLGPYTVVHPRSR